MKLLLCVLALAGMAAGQAVTLQSDKAHKFTLEELKRLGVHFPGKCAGSVVWDAVTNTCSLPPPRSVPAVRKTRKVQGHWLACSTGTLCSSDVWIPEHEESYWDCADPDRALLVSVNGKKAVCLLVDELQDSR